MCAGLTPDAGDGACETRDYVQQQRTPITKSEGFVIIKGGGGGGGGGDSPASWYPICFQCRLIHPPWGVRDFSKCIPTSRGATTNQRFRSHRIRLPYCQRRDQYTWRR